MARPYWTVLGEQARGLVLSGHLKLIVYWSRGDVGEEGGPGGEQGALPPGFYTVFADRPDEHIYETEADRPDDESWEQACLQAARGFGLEGL